MYIHDTLLWVGFSQYASDFHKSPTAAFAVVLAVDSLISARP